MGWSDRVVEGRKREIKGGREGENKGEVKGSGEGEKRKLFQG